MNLFSPSRQRLLLALFLIAVARVAAAGQDPWLEVETDHFRFIYKKQDSDTLRTLLSFAEKVYQKIEVLVGTSPQKIVCVIDGSGDRANGAFIPLPNQIWLLTAPPTGDVLGSGVSSGWLRTLLLHELVHYFHLTSRKGLNLLYRYLFGPTTSSGVSALFTPGWAIEGPAVLAESLLTSGGRGRNPYFEVFYKAYALENSFPSLSQASYNEPFITHGRIYVVGYALMDYLFQQYGDDIFEKILEKYTKHYSFSLAVKQTTGLWISRIYSQMQKALRLRYAEDFLLPENKLLSPLSESWSLPQKTSRGWFGYRRRESLPSAIVWKKSLSGKEQILLETSLSDTHSLAVKKDGSQLIFASRSGTTISDLFLLNVNSGHLQRLSSKARLLQPALSRNGERLIAIQENFGYTRLVQVDLDTHQISSLFDRKGINVVQPALSPSGRWAAFRINAEKMGGLYLLDLEDEEALPQPLALSKSSTDTHPFFVDEDRIVFSSSREDALKLYMWDRSSALFFRIGEDRIGVLEGIVAGDQVVYRTYGDRRYQIKELALLPTPVDEELFAEGLDLPLPFPTNPAETPLPPVKSYWPIPYPQVWAPTLSFTPLNSSGGSWKFGFLILGEDYTHSTTWSFATDYLHSHKQLAAKTFLKKIAWHGNGNRLNFDWQGILTVGFEQNYMELSYIDRHLNSFWEQQSNPFLNYQHSHQLRTPRYQLLLFGKLGVNYYYSRIGEASFDLLNSRKIPLTNKQDLLLRTEISLGLYSAATAPLSDTHPPLVRLSAESLFPLTFSTTPGTLERDQAFRVSLDGGIALPRGQFLLPCASGYWSKLAIASFYTTPKKIGTPRTNFPTSLRLTLKYRLPLAFTDWAFPPMISLRKISAEASVFSKTDFRDSDLETSHSQIYGTAALHLKVGFSHPPGVVISPSVSYRFFSQNPDPASPLSLQIELRLPYTSYLDSVSSQREAVVGVDRSLPSLIKKVG